MNEPQDLSAMAVRLTDAAARRIKAIVTAEGASATMVRLAVQGGGCAGYQYQFSIESSADPADDIVIEKDGARLVVDTVSLDLLTGSEVDYGESLMEAGFQVRNPRAASSCGCGTSFSLKD